MTHPIYLGIKKHYDASKVNRAGDRLVRPNTRIAMSCDGVISIWLYSTEIIRAYTDGRVTVRTGGYATNTTKDRISYFLHTLASAHWLDLHHKNKRLLVRASFLGDSIPFVEGSTFDFTTFAVLPPFGL